MVSFGTLSISLLLLAGQSVVLAGLLWIAPDNRAANRFLGLLIFAIALMVTPYIIGFAGFYDTYPWLSFAPFSTSLSFGPLLYLHIYALIHGRTPERWGLHLVPYGVQFLSLAHRSNFDHREPCLDWPLWRDNLAALSVLSAPPCPDPGR